jgi:hypothetical protein
MCDNADQGAPSAPAILRLPRGFHWQAVDVDHLEGARSGIGKKKRVAVGGNAELTREGSSGDGAQ